MNTASIIKQVAPIALPIAKRVCVGILGALAEKYALRITAAHILSERDKDVQKALEQDLKLKNKISKQHLELLQSGGIETVEALGQDNKYIK